MQCNINCLQLECFCNLTQISNFINNHYITIEQDLFSYIITEGVEICQSSIQKNVWSKPLPLFLHSPEFFIFSLLYDIMYSTSLETSCYCRQSSTSLSADTLSSFLPLSLTHTHKHTHTHTHTYTRTHIFPF